MQRAKNMAYATAGVQMMAGIEMNVRSHVFIPDAEAGSEGYRPSYRPEQVVERKNELTLSRNAAALFLAIVFVIFGALVLHKCVERKALADNLAQTRTRIELVKQNIENQQQALTEARDINRIRYLATREYHMVSAESVDSIPVIAPETRIAYSYTNGLVSGSPLEAGHGMISGSR